MPIREFLCPIHGKFEKFCGTATYAECPYLGGLTIDENANAAPIICRYNAPVVEFSVPAKRNPRHGEG
jgi:hypothetical protein